MHCLPTEHQRAVVSKVTVRSRSNWNLVMLVFEEGGKPENPGKNPQSMDENQQQIQPTYDAESGHRTRDHIKSFRDKLIRFTNALLPQAPR